VAQSSLLRWKRPRWVTPTEKADHALEKAARASGARVGDEAWHSGGGHNLVATGTGVMDYDVR
jgi:hypothetical protein